MSKPDLFFSSPWIIRTLGRRKKYLRGFLTPRTAREIWGEYYTDLAQQDEPVLLTDLLLFTCLLEIGEKHLKHLRFFRYAESVEWEIGSYV